MFLSWLHIQECILINRCFCFLKEIEREIEGPDQITICTDSAKTLRIKRKTSYLIRTLNCTIVKLRFKIKLSPQIFF